MRRSSFLAVPLLLGLCACQPLQQAVQVPTMHVQSIQLQGLSLPTGAAPAVAHIALKLQVGNPNALPVHLANIASQLVIDGQNAGEVNLPNVSLPARGETVQDAQLDIPVTLNTAAAFFKVARGQEVSYRLDGRFTADLGALGQPTFGPFTLSQGVWKQPAILPF